MPAVGEWTQEELHRIFDGFDLNRSGTVSANEIAHAARSAGVAIEEAELLELIHLVDEDRSGDLDLREFVNLMRLDDGRLLQIVSSLHEKYLDEKARQYGAEASEFYTPEMVVARDQLKSDPFVEAALRAAWERLVPAESDRMERAAYDRMYRLIYLALHAEDAEGIHPEDCMAGVEDDWAEDSRGKGHLLYADFARSWFQLADLNTAKVCAAEYAHFLTRLAERITRREGGLRDDREVFEACQLRWSRAVGKQCALWAAHFGVTMEMAAAARAATRQARPAGGGSAGAARPLGGSASEPVLAGRGARARLGSAGARGGGGKVWGRAEAEISGEARGGGKGRRAEAEGLAEARVGRGSAGRRARRAETEGRAEAMGGGGSCGGSRKPSVELSPVLRKGRQQPHNQAMARSLDSALSSPSCSIRLLKPRKALPAYQYPLTSPLAPPVVRDCIPDEVPPVREAHPPNCPCYVCARQHGAISYEIKASRRVRLAEGRRASPVREEHRVPLLCRPLISSRPTGGVPAELS
ncbi:hypothetical protein AB1Y20_021553 [Prymnesium parvum]|uniref:EF-hand domain-containing protein n=1 Tax=Prymnesium parvum TaxID=97485 RepID=A0AB34JLW2_PRYPA